MSSSSSPHADPEESVTSRTFRLELVRSMPLGMLETLMATFAVLIAVTHFEARDGIKAFILASSQFGLLASVAVVPMMRALGWRPTTVSGTLGLIASAGLVLAAVVGDSLVWYVGGIAFGFFVFMVQIPLMTQIYQTNYPGSRRGTLFAITTVARGLSAVAFGWWGGELLDTDFSRFPVLLWAFAGASVFSAACMFVMPSEPLAATRKRVGLFHSLRWLRKDKAFRILIVSWMLMGLANLTGIKLWVEYLANPEFGHGFSPGQVVLLTLTIPLSVKLAATYHWGILFDRLNFYLLRVILNGFFAVAVLLVYLGGNIWIIAIGMAMQGFAFAGGNIAWSLWVTKIAPPERVAEYMSVHTFMTGVRGAAAPFLGYWILNAASPAFMGIGCACLMFLAAVVIWPEVHLGPPRRKGELIEPRGPGA